MKPLPWLNMNAKPKAKKSKPQRQVSTMHSIRTFTVSRDRQNPASSMVKPTCIPNTRKAATKVQTVLSGLTTSAALTSTSAARTRPKKRLVITVMMSSTKPMPIALPANRSFPYRRHSGSPKRVFRRVNFSAIGSFLPLCSLANIDRSLIRVN